MAMAVARPYRAVMEIAERQRRGDGVDFLFALADAQDRHVAVVEDAAQDALVDVDALDLVEAHLERLAA